MNKRNKIILGVAIVAVLLVVIGIVVYFCTKSDDDKSNNDDDHPVVNITQPHGRVRGHPLTTSNGTKYYAFQGIPYARPPVGNDRFKVPTRHNDWHDILDATGNKKICMQKLTSNPLNLTVTEDCLYLNIYTPNKPGESNSTLLPVLIWVHPGDFIHGAGILEYWGPQFFIDYGVIVVTMNYRLGPFGFLWAGDNTIPGNLGLRDQLFVYNWIHVNIEAFGGDPFNIGLAGQASGAASVSYHMINTRARDSLFSCAIMHSGSSLSPSYFQPEPLVYAYKLAKKLDSTFSTKDTQALRDLLIKISAEDIQKAGEEIADEAGSDGVIKDLIWLPVVEGYTHKNAYLQWQMLTAYTVGEIRIVPAMLGFNSEEMIKLSTLSNVGDLAQVYDKQPSLIPSKKLPVPDDIRSKLGKEIKDLYTDSTFEKDTGAFIRYLSDQVTAPIIKQAYNSTWYNLNVLYQFSYKGDLGGDNNRTDYPSGTEHVGHGEELKYLWDDGTNSDPSQYSEEDRLTQQRLLTLWTNFLKYQNPTPKPDEVLNYVSWKYMNETIMTYLNINTTLEIKSEPRVFDKLNEIIDQYIEDPLTVF